MRLQNVFLILYFLINDIQSTITRENCIEKIYICELYIDFPFTEQEF